MPITKWESQFTDFWNSSKPDLVQVCWIRELDTWAPVDSHGFILSKEVWLEFCKEGSPFYDQFTADDIDVINYHHLSDVREPPVLPSPKPRRIARSGAVYLMRSGSGHYKIGQSTRPIKRREQIDKASNHRVTLVCAIQTEDMRDLEESLHKKFADRRIGNSEWFALSESEVQSITALAKDGE